MNLFNRFTFTLAMCVIFLFGLMTTVIAQQNNYDLLISGGHVIDPGNQINAVMDVAIKDGQIASVEDHIPDTQAGRVVDASGLYVTPGLVDMHTHNYYGTEPFEWGYNLAGGDDSLPPDGFTFRAGVTTVVDVGGAGWRNFEHFKSRVIDRSRTRVLAFINIVGDGMKAVIEQDLNDMDPEMTARVAELYDDLIVGVKIAHYDGHDWEPIHRLVEAGERAGLPVMVDFGSADPPLSLRTLFLEKLRPGDIYTHTYSGVGGREDVVDSDGQLRDGIQEARERGIVFDVGHGGGSFWYSVAVPAMEQGLTPTTISTDLWRSPMNAGLKDMANLLSKFMALGMSIQDVIEASTVTPANVIGRDDLGHLGEGAVADVAIFNLQEGDFGFIDSVGYVLSGSRKLTAELTISGGQVVWDLNGLDAEPFTE